MTDASQQPQTERRAPAPVSQAYRALVDGGQFTLDPAQAEAVSRMAQLQTAWQRDASAAAQVGVLGRLFGRRTQDGESHKQGLYLWGDVGRGKSMLMDLLHETTPMKLKRRVHFHAFMADVHARIHQWREENRDDLKTKDPIPPLAASLAAQAELLCLDEFQVHDVADAMILGRLFTALLNLNVKVVFTSNRKPDDLYLHGLQRDRFLKFVELVHERLTVIHINSAEDYRLKKLRAMAEVYLVGNERQTREKMNEAFSELTHGAPAKSTVLNVQGHDFPIPAYYGDVARFSFNDLCAKALGASDYIVLAQEFHTVLIDDIPLLSPEKRNEAKRFVTLIDTLYEHKVKLVCSAAADPEKLYPTGDGSFEFARTASRLVEMQSETYLAASHRVE